MGAVTMLGRIRRALSMRAYYEQRLAALRGELERCERDLMAEMRDHRETMSECNKLRSQMMERR